MNEKKAVVLLSGGLDSATCLAIAKSEGFAIHTLTFSYGQRHKVELDCARRLAEAVGVVKHHLISFDLREWGGSALTSDDIDVPDAGGGGIPATYVPARNTIFLSFATAANSCLRMTGSRVRARSILRETSPKPASAMGATRNWFSVRTPQRTPPRGVPSSTAGA